MFQYAAARAVADQRGVPLLVDATSGFRWNIHGRQYELHGFPLTAELGKATVGRLAHAAIRRVEDAAMRRGRYHLPLLQSWLKHGTRHVTGFFQSPLYFEKSAATIRAEFQLRHVPPAVAAVAAAAAGCESVGLHIRMQHAMSANGDRVTPEFSGPCYQQELLAYYRAAVEQIRASVAHPHWIIVTDTQPFDPAVIGLTGPVTIHYPDAANPPAADQWLLSQCQHVVVGRSTFSWWAAWLRGPNRGITHAPRIFYPGGSSAASKDVYPADWRIL